MRDGARAAAGSGWGLRTHEPDGKAHEEVRDGGPEVARGDVEALLFVKLLVFDVPLLLFIGRGRVESAMKLDILIFFAPLRDWRQNPEIHTSKGLPPALACPVCTG